MSFSENILFEPYNRNNIWSKTKQFIRELRLLFSCPQYLYIHTPKKSERFISSTRCKLDFPFSFRSRGKEFQSYKLIIIIIIIAVVVSFYNLVRVVYFHNLVVLCELMR